MDNTKIKYETTQEALIRLMREYKKEVPLNLSQSDATVMAEMIKQNAAVKISEAEMKNAAKDRVCKYICTAADVMMKGITVLAGGAMFFAGLEQEREGSITSNMLRSFSSKSCDIYKKF